MVLEGGLQFQHKQWAALAYISIFLSLYFLIHMEKQFFSVGGWGGGGGCLACLEDFSVVS